MFDHFPLYNKFRVPTMALIIPQLLFPVMAALTIHRIGELKEAGDWKKFRMAMLATLVVFAMAGVYYASADFSKENKQRTAEFNKIVNEGGGDVEAKMAKLDNNFKPKTDNQLYEGMFFNFKGQPDAQKNAREFVSALRKDRAGLFFSDIMRSLLFVLAAAALIALFIKSKINSTILYVGLGLATLIDLMGFRFKLPE
ncbi:MAG: hypothetical protein V9E88_16875 [Ferruginibacter sp.]